PTWMRNLPSGLGEAIARATSPPWTSVLLDHPLVAVAPRAGEWPGRASSFSRIEAVATGGGGSGGGVLATGAAAGGGGALGPENSDVKKPHPLSAAEDVDDWARAVTGSPLSVRPASW